ncbi:TauD/TfdA family dioxygenase [Pseudomonas cichorii]|uniref:TauD/TfdA family dioxygenase n=1 Tax=Pseudomonas cichorii TaxID=36746 RepID=UPI001C8A5036|nr:TauD/TfdA family dioxygenase [Pseudomonas cichorii]MBX8494162.1 TauD/TfdA family dioxygenase [Pseudomonas cichorii]
MLDNPLEFCLSALNNPVELGASLLPAIESGLSNVDLTLEEVQRHAWINPLIHLRAVFDVHELPETPTSFIPVPDVASTVAARACAVACLAALNSNTISYGSENDGHLFVNLVVLPGDDDFADKSKSDMRGHTDGVSFPIRGQLHEFDGRVAPSPDFVCLSGLRNPDETETTVMPLSAVLQQLTYDEINELTKPQYVVRPQKTFKRGLRKLFGKDSPLLDAMSGIQLLFEGDNGYWIRYSHSAADTDFDSELASQAITRFEEACQACSTSVVISPGDILIVNNRVGLHGRGVVGGEAGGVSRWLLRTYGLDTRSLTAEQRYVDSPYKLFP